MVINKNTRLIISDIDNTLIGDAEALNKLFEELRHADNLHFGVATGRRLDSAVSVLEEWQVPKPVIFITSVGSEIHYAPNLIKDEGWKKHINEQWEPERLKKTLETFTLAMQPKLSQREFKVSYFVDHTFELWQPKLDEYLQQNNLSANMIYSSGKFLDFLPKKASKGLAVRYLANKWGLPLKQFLVAGDSGNDEEMLTSGAFGIVVRNYSFELEKLKNNDNIYFANGSNAQGILEGIKHFNFLNSSLMR
jgi:sucrose-phosphate synthase